MTNEQRIQLINRARELVGAHYKYGASLEEAPGAFDCSSFIQYLFRSVGIEIPRSALLQAGDPKGEELLLDTEFEPGDLLFMRGNIGHYNDELFGGRKIDVGHVALYLGEGKIIHAQSSAGGVIEQLLEECIKEPGYAIVYAKRF